MNNFLGRTIEKSYIIGSINIKQQNIPYNQCTLLIMSWVFVFFVLFLCFVFTVSLYTSKRWRHPYVTL